MSEFLESVKSSMASNRRTTSTPTDWVFALKAYGLEPHMLLPYLTIPPTSHITQPTLDIEEPIPAHLLEADSASDALLFPPSADDAAAKRLAKYIPKHLPRLPSAHTWQNTPVNGAKEYDALKIRERATQEGVMAERALRRLMAAQSVSRSGSGKAAGRKNGRRKVERDESVFAKALQSAETHDQDTKRREEATGGDNDFDDEDSADEGDLMHLDSAPKTTNKQEKNTRLDMSLEPGLAVNYDRGHWRLEGRGRTG
jgi:transcription initiation factor TFIID subunit 8